MLFMNNFINYLMSSKNLSYWWNFGSMLFFLLVLQIISGILLMFFYSVVDAFDNIEWIMKEVSWGWILRLIHMNIVSFIMLFIFFHFIKAILFNSYSLIFVWSIGLFILLFMMMEAFLGYVLIWSQMSFWACTVITSLFMVIPFWGLNLVFWIWGDFFVSCLTGKIFLVLHFIIPFLLLILIFFHLFFLHFTGSSSKMSMYFSIDKISFFPGFWLKDSINFIWLSICFIWLFFKWDIFGDSEMFLEMNNLLSPVHIIPEWYFLFCYDILRSIPNKLFGVIMLLLSLLCYFLMIFIGFFNLKYNYIMFIFWLMNMFMLSWLGGCFVEMPFVSYGMILSLFYFKIINKFFLEFYIYSS